LYLHFYLLYLLSNSCDGNDYRNNAFSSVDGGFEKSMF